MCAGRNENNQLEETVQPSVDRDMALDQESHIELAIMIMIMAVIMIMIMIIIIIIIIIFLGELESSQVEQPWED